MKSTALASTLLVLALVFPANASATIVASVNGTDAPFTPDMWSAVDVGWYYTPSSNLDVTELGTEFGPTVTTNDVTFQIFDGSPTASHLVATGDGVIPNSDSFTTESFAPITMTAGTKYFIGLEGVLGDGVDVTSDPGATNLGNLYYDMSGDDSFSMVDSSQDLNSNPILEFGNDGTPVSAPEPSTWALLFGSLVLLAICHRLRLIRLG